MQKLLESKEYSSLLDFQQDIKKRIVTARQDIETGDCIASISKSLELSNDFDLGLSIDEFRETLSNHGKYEYGVSTFKLMMTMNWIRYSSNDSNDSRNAYWLFYLSSLPETFNLPVEWKEETLELIKGTDLYKITIEKKAWIRDATEIGKTSRPEWDWINIENMMWSYCVISSRSFPKRPGEICLWPILDYLDHDPNSKVEWIISESKVSFVSRSRITAGSIVFNNYGPKGNENLLNNYGFVIKDNPFDYVKVTLNSGNDPLRKEKDNFIRNSSLRFKDSWLLFYEDSEIPADMISFCRILLCNEFEWENLNKETGDIREISVRNQVATLTTLISLLENKLGPYLSAKEKVNQSQQELCDILIYLNSQIKILNHHISLAKWRLDEYISSVNFFWLDSDDLDSDFLNLCRNIEDIDEDTLLCLCLVNEKERNGPFSTSLSKLPVIINDNQEEQEHFEAYVLPYFESDYINLKSLQWASSILTIHGGYDQFGRFGVWF